MQPYRSPWMNEEMDALRVTARRFFQKEVAPHATRWRQQGKIDREVWRKAGELGLLCLKVPKEFGGQGLTIAHEAVVLEEQARIADTAFPYVPGSCGGPNALIRNGTLEQIAKWVPKVITGEHIICACITEPSGGSDVRNLQTIARLEGDEYVINGSKTFITMGSQADIAMVVARTGAPGVFSSFIVDIHNSPGFKLGRALEKVGQIGIDTHEVFLEDLRVPRENLVGCVEGRQYAPGREIIGFGNERLVISITAVATAERAVELAVEYTKQRKMFGQTEWDFQNTRFRLAECATEVRVGRVFVDSLIMRVLAGETLDNATAAMAKTWCTDMQNRVIDQCLQFFGGYGYMMEYPIARLFVDARVQKIYGGANEPLKGVIAKSL